MSLKEVIDAAKIYIDGGDERLRSSLSYVFPDTEYVVRSYAKEETANCTLSDDRFNQIPLKEYVKKANMLTSQQKKIVLWGAGNIGRRCVNQWNTLYPHRTISEVIDNKPELNNSNFGGHIIKNFESIKERIDEYYIVVCMEEYLDAFLFLKSLGCKEYEDFVHWSNAFYDNGKLLYMTLKDTSRYDFLCKRPFGFLDIVEGGIFVCCPSSVKNIPIGHFDDCFTEEILHTERARIMQLSVINHTYTFCNKEYCLFYNFHNSEKVNDEIDDTKVSAEIKSVMLGVDDSCNLQCPSCRNSMIINDKALHPYRVEKAKSFINGFGRDLDDICIAGGEPFFSKLMRTVMECSGWRTRKSISILCNATLLNETNFHRFVEGHRMINITLSIDGAKKDTYERLRKNGRFETVMSNLAMLGRLRRENKISCLEINYCLQADNADEMGMIRAIAYENYVDRVNMLKIFNVVGLDEAEFDQKYAIVDEKKVEIKDEYKKYFVDELVNDPIFNWGLMAPYVGAEKKEALFCESYALM